MSYKFTDLSSSVSSSRLGANSGQGYTAGQRTSCQLSDGTLVFMDNDGTNWYLKYYTHSGSPTTIATVTSVNSSEAGVSICRDISNNIYVIGSPSEEIVIQAFKKGTGYTWTAESSLNWSPAHSGVIMLNAVWTNDGGGTSGAGHILVAVSCFNYTSSYPSGILITFDAGVALAGTGTILVSSSEVVGTSYFSPAIESSGFGGTSGWVGFTASTGPGFYAYSWSISNTGAITTTNLGSISTYTLSVAGPVAEIIDVGGGIGVFISSSYSGGYQATSCSLTGQIGTSTLGSPANWPQDVLTSQWDAFTDPTTAGKGWVLALGPVSGGVVTIYAATFNLNGSNIPTWNTTVTSIDSWSIYALPLVMCFSCVKRPFAGLIDFLSDAETTSGTYALLNDNVSLEVTPTSTLVSPYSGAYADLTTPTFTWTYNNTDGSTQSYWAFRQMVAGGSSYSYWNGTGWQSTIYWNAGNNPSYQFPSGAFSNGTTYDWNVAVESSYGLQGTFTSSDDVVTGQVAPTVSITAPTGSQSTSEPKVTYTTTKASGTSIISYRIMIYPSSVSSPVPGVTPGWAWDSGVQSGTPPSGGVTVSTPLTNETSFVTYMQITETGNESSAWTTGPTFSEAYSLPPTPTVVVTTGQGTNGVPCNIIEITEGTTTDTDLTVTIAWVDANGSGYVRYNGDTFFNQSGAVPITTGTPLYAYDYESTPTVSRTYSVTISGYTSTGTFVTSNPGTGTATLSINSWWFIEPLDPSVSLGLVVTKYSASQYANTAAHFQISDSSTPAVPTTVNAGVFGQNGTITVQTQSQSQYNSLLSSLQSGTVKWMINPFGQGEYVLVSLADPSGTGGTSGQVHSTDMSNSPATSPYRESSITYLEVGQP